ncbi:hypothetical protein ACFQ7W_34940 [Streptomyces niveus]|uniref:hypothetical protein n=1 Tax=Streptomyces niveus TaxID=193462 RepID=UPI00369EF05A
MNKSQASGGWQRALTRAGQIAAVDHPSALRTDQHWDWVAIRGILAVVLQALATQTSRAPEDVSLDELAEHCSQGGGHIRALAVPLVGEELAYGLDTAPAAPVPAVGAPLVDTWLWLTRLWPPDVPDDVDGLPPLRSRQYGDLTRSTGRGSPVAAVDAVPDWAARAAVAAMGAV